MRDTVRRIAVALGAAGLVLLPGHAVQAQLDQLKNPMGSGQGIPNPGIGNLGGAMPSVDNASPTNLAGLLQYCIRNNYLSGGEASSVKDSLLTKATGAGGGATDSRFRAGDKGMLETGKGQNFALGGSGIQGQATHKVCDLALQHAKSML
jgi:hypothetical protein